jgi:hypothetical protein
MIIGFIVSLIYLLSLILISAIMVRKKSDEIYIIIFIFMYSISFFCIVWMIRG